MKALAAAALQLHWNASRLCYGYNITYHGFSEQGAQCEQQGNWHHKQDQQYLCPA